MIDSDDNDDNNANRNGKTNQIATTGTTHAASSSSTSGIATTTTMASITPTVYMSEEDRRAMDVLSDVLIQACMAMFVTSLGLRTVRKPPLPPPSPSPPYHLSRAYWTFYDILVILVF